jgi:thiol-disulfide isomerase/thioredoxin
VALAAAAAVGLLAAGLAGAADLALTDPAGTAVDWSEWIRANGPAAVLVWASWAPGAEAAIDGLRDLAEAARSQGLKLVVVDVHEELEAARRGLDRTGVPWLHDRHGSILKEYRLIRLPILVAVDTDGRAFATIDPSADTLRRLPR